jgi:adenine-specific DNA-methyltransferase
MPSRLSDWGYQVSTGPLVWNRFKTQLRSKTGKDTFPLVWAEAVAGPNRFIHRAEKRSHEPYFYARAKDAWLKVSVPCVLLQRTTAKEQPRRLIAAEMPLSFIEKHGAVIVENHLNMIKPIAGKQLKVSTAALSALMNSGIADAAFRCISGSVAVSAFELEALPLPSADAMATVDKLIRKCADAKTIESSLRALYLGESNDAP